MTDFVCGVLVLFTQIVVFSSYHSDDLSDRGYCTSMLNMTLIIHIDFKQIVGSPSFC